MLNFNSWVKEFSEILKTKWMEEMNIQTARKSTYRCRKEKYDVKRPIKSLHLTEDWVSIEINEI